MRALVVVVVLAACGDNGVATPDAAVDAAELDAAVPPVFRNPVDTEDLALAQAAADVLGMGASTRCDRCHALSRPRVEQWLAYTQWSDISCLADKAPTTPPEAMAILDCLRTLEGAPSLAAAVGINATAARLPWFEYVFRLAYGAGWQAPYDDFVEMAGMPRDGAPFTQAEFDLVAEWFDRGLPHLEEMVGSEPAPPPCTGDIQPAVAAHVAAMQTAGWGAINRDEGVLMYGCAGASTPRDCLAAYPRASEHPWAVGWEAAAPSTVIRMLRPSTYASSYWTRSSADGRFVSHGGRATGIGAAVIDLQQDREIPAAALYDPAFFPDNSGFLILGDRGGFCAQSLLTSSPAEITFDEPECSAAPAAGYQHLGAAHGGDYWTIYGQGSSDNGGQQLTSVDPWADFDPAAQSFLVPLVHTGNAYVAQAPITVVLPHEGDAVISPSSRLVISRIGTPSSRQNGWSLRQVIATPSGGSYQVSTPAIARYCGHGGGKPTFSFDERWLVYHHYVEADDWQSLGYASADDPGFVALRATGSANLFLLDLTTGVERRITAMGPGQYALFPHFRSDGWIYAVVRDRNRFREDLIASDAALAYQ